ncbi:hypothetical protein E4T56_gene19061 [Termitomyces sp. T112]|nr:hypothetical protein E4T56_gene19061 [Termitomyces sp. T112]
MSRPVPRNPAHRPSNPRTPKRTPNAPPNFCPCPAPTSANSDASPANSDGPLGQLRTTPAIPNLRHPSLTQHPASSDLFRSITTTSGQPAFSNDPINISARHDLQSQPTPAHSVKPRQAPPPQPTYPEVLR